MSKSKKKESPLVAGLSGGIAGCVEATVVWPSEYVKTQLQLQVTPVKGAVGEAAKPMYTGAIDCAVKTVRANGPLGLYRGLAPILVFTLPKASVRFGAYSYTSGFLRDADGKMTASKDFVAGAMAGIVEAAAVVTPQETVKTKLINANKGVVAGIKHIIATEGPAGLYKGFVPTLGKQASNQGIRFLTYGEYKRRMQDWTGNKDLTGWQSALGGMFAGCCSVLGNNPIDTVKTRMQGLQASQYKGTWECVMQVMKKEGPLAFYKGTIPRMARVVPGQAILFSSYESISQIVEAFVEKDKSATA